MSEAQKVASFALCRESRSHRRVIGPIVFLLMIPLLFVQSPAFAISGRDVFAKVNEVRRQGLTRKSQVTMVLHDKTGQRTRTVTSYSKRGVEESYKALVIFRTPPELKDVSFLILARTFRDRHLWAYFPAYKRTRRIPTTSQDDSFFGADFSYDDFGGPPKLEDYRFRILKEEAVDGHPCYVVEVVPKRRRGFTRYVSWISKEWWIPLKIEYYRDKELHKLGAFKDVRVIDNIPTPFFLEMENQKTGHRTEITVQAMQYNPDLPDSLFTERSLKLGLE